MLGMELEALCNHSPFFRTTGKQGVLSLLMASYLLYHHKIRVLVPLTTMLKGNPGKARLSIMRIQPPVTITNELVEIRLMIGVMGFKPYPIISPITPTITSIFNFCLAVRSLMSNLPANTPHIVCAVVGIALKETQ